MDQHLPACILADFGQPIKPPISTRSYGARRRNAVRATAWPRMGTQATPGSGTLAKIAPKSIASGPHSTDGAPGSREPAPWAVRIGKPANHYERRNRAYDSSLAATRPTIPHCIAEAVVSRARATRGPRGICPPRCSDVTRRCYLSRNTCFLLTHFPEVSLLAGNLAARPSQGCRGREGHQYGARAGPACCDLPRSNDAWLSGMLVAISSGGVSTRGRTRR